MPAFYLPASLSACLPPAIRPGCASATASVFTHNKGNHVGFTKIVVPRNVYPLHHGISFYPLLVSFHLQIAYRKVRNLRIGVNKLVG